MDDAMSAFSKLMGDVGSAYSAESSDDDTDFAGAATSTSESSQEERLRRWSRKPKKEKKEKRAKREKKKKKEKSRRELRSKERRSKSRGRDKDAPSYRDNPCPHCRKYKRFKQHPKVPFNKCLFNKRYKGYHPVHVCDMVGVPFKARSEFPSDLGGYASSSSSE